jgi:hypothetical protein
MIYLPFKNLKNFTERGQKKFKKIIAHNGWVFVSGFALHNA